MRIKILTILAMFAITLTTAFAEAAGWMTDFELAKKKAQTENKDLLLAFTGTNWCARSNHLKHSVTSKQAFIKPASEHFILVKLDYPCDKSLSKDQKAQKDNLLTRYGIREFPSVLLCDNKGLPYAIQKFHFQQSPESPKTTPESYLANLIVKLPAKKQFHQALKDAEKLQGKAKAEALWKAIINLQGVPIATSFDPVLKAILAADSTDKGGKIKGIYLNAALATLREGDDYKPLFKKFDAFLNEQKIMGEKKQQMLTKKVNILYKLKDFNGMRRVIEEIIAIDPNTTVGKGLIASKPRIDMIEAAYKKSKNAKKIKSRSQK